MRKRSIIGFLLAIVATLSFSFGSALAAPGPIGFCMPDLDGHCRYCEIRFAPVSMRCVGG
jgi:hypothetical protein